MTKTSSPLEGMLVGLSVSDSPDLQALGLSQTHLDHAYIELARQLLVAGASIAYGGDLRPGGFTDRLVDLVLSYSRPDRPRRDRIRQYLAWPLHADRKLETDSGGRFDALSTVSTVVRVERPANPPTHSHADLPQDLQAQVLDSESFTLMRRRMSQDIDARVVLGGKLSGYRGRLPGIAEEAILALEAGKPVYVLGGFGGCAARLGELAEGGTPDDLNVETLRRRDPQYARLLSALPENPGDDIAVLRRAGVDGLQNGLSAGQNRALFTLSDIDEIVALVLRGLRLVR